VVGANDSGGSGYNLGAPQVHDGVSTWSALTGDLVFTIRSPYPRLEPMKPQVHFQIWKDTTRYLRLTERGMEDFGLCDGAVLHLTGQGAPALPTADSSVLEVPYDYAVARAGMHLAASFKDYMGSSAPQMIAAWKTIVGDIEAKMNPGVHPGSLEIEAL
jgi:hypothetical protein